MPSAKPKLVIIGHGLSGARAAKEAAALGIFDVCVLESKQFTELFKGYTIREGTCKELRATAAILDSGEELPFDFCVLAMGSRHTGAGVIQAVATTLAGRREELKAAAASISAAKDIVVVGGGPVGIEVVGEILEQYAGKSLTLIHSGTQLVQGKSLGVHQACMQLMKQHGVKVMLEDKAESWDQASKVLTTRSGVKVPADYVIWAAGSSPNTQLLATSVLAPTLDSQGRVKTCKLRWL
ncbi:pyr_redox_2 domain-containing protein [Haematococcus lacustris]|uniref:Pyr_redox_2 domain-containing protein n=1 Tax=Haematococcus lacustris TaxID=44745 RepID=A0A699YR02_HAELA|nr:pyr_redox_2 domain-containing protein [Haematococcus lacustris]